MDIASVPHYDSLHSDPSFKSKFSLQFQSKKMEKSYRQLILSDVATTLGLNHQERITTYVYTFSCVSVLFNASYLSTYFEKKSELSTLLTEVIILVSATIIGLLIYYFLFHKAMKTTFKSLLLILSYLAICEVIIVNNCLVKRETGENPIDYGFSSILGVLPLIYTSKFAIFHSFILYLFINFAISLSYLIIALVSEVNTQRVLIDFFFLLLILVLESRSFYSQEVRLREKYISVNVALSSTKKIEDRSPKTDIEEISHTIKEAIQLIPLISQQKVKNQVYIDKIFENLSKVMNMLGNRNSVYSVDIEALDKGIDNEEKKYLEETCIAPRRTQARSSTKYLVRKTIEVLSTYEIQELVGILKRIGKEWNFNVFFLQECSQNKPLSALGCYCMQKFHFDSSFIIPQSVSTDFFSSLEGLYKPNPYHNSSHATDVLSSYLYLVEQSVFKDFLQDYELFASVIALLGHDVAHPGVTNRFLINSKNGLAITCKFLHR